MTILTKEQVEAYHRDGYVIARNVFTADEVASFKRAIAARPNPEHTDANLFVMYGLRDLWRDQRLIDLARQLVGDPLVFFGEAGITSFRFSGGEHISGRHLHHDAKGTPGNIFNRLHAPQTENYPVVRFGLYLEDYESQSGGLKVSPGSHKIDTSAYDLAALPYENLATRPGDVACFTLRVLHSPFALRLKDDPSLALSPFEEDVKYADAPGAFLPSPRERDTIFIDYARESEFTDLQIKSRALHVTHAKGRVGFINALKVYNIEQAAQEAGLKLRLDYCLVDAVQKVSENIENGMLRDEAMPYLAMLTRLCRSSRSTSPHFSLFDDPADGNSPEGILRLVNEIIPRLSAYRSDMHSSAVDQHMAAVSVPALKAKIAELRNAQV